MPIVRNEHRGLYAALFAVFTLFGASVTVIGASLPRILDLFGWDYRIAGLVLAAGAVGSFSSNYVAGRVVGRIGARKSLAFGLLLDAAALSLFALTPSPSLNVLLFFLVGFGQGFLEVGVNWAVIRMDRGEGSGRALNIMHGAFSLGALASPLAAGALIAAEASSLLVYRVIAAVFCLLALGLAALPFGLLGREAAPEAGRRAGSGRGAVALLGFAALFLYVGAEIGVSNWSAEFFVRALGASEAAGALTVSLFWGGLLAGRFGFPLLLPRARQERLLTGLASAFSVCVGLLAATGRAGPPALPLAVVAVTLAGLAASCVYPVVVSLVGRASPGAEGAAIGAASTGGGIGGFVFPFVMSRIASSHGVGAGFLFYAAVAVAGAAAAYALTRASAAALGAERP